MKAENIDRNVDHIHLILHKLQSIFCKVICKKLLFEVSIFQRFNGVVCMCDVTFNLMTCWWVVKGNCIQIAVCIFRPVYLGRRAWEPLYPKGELISQWLKNSEYEIIYSCYRKLD